MTMREMRSELIAVLIAVNASTPHVLTLDHGNSLPSGPLETSHASLQKGVRSWVERQTSLQLGHLEQLYTFADPSCSQNHTMIRISYMALTRVSAIGGGWRDWYSYFPWEDRRSVEGRHALTLAEEGLRRWAQNDATRMFRCALNFGLDGRDWEDEWVLQRYELLWEAGLLPESRTSTGVHVPGHSMPENRRRILATAIARLRAKIRYRPVFFELLPECFTLWQLQQTVEAIAGRNMHKQNFRRIILQQNLVEEVPGFDSNRRGRPARLFRFRPAIRGARGNLGTRLPISKAI